MRRTQFLLVSALGIGGALLAAAGPAQAATCSAEIMALQQHMTATPGYASIAPGDGTIPGTTNADPGPAPLPEPGTAVAAPGKTLGAPASNDPGGGGHSAHAVPSGSGEAGATPGSDPLPTPAARGGVLVDSTMPAPAETEPMDEDETQAGEVMPEGGTDPDAAAKALARARAFDQAGDEAACMNAVEEAKSYLGEL